LPEDVRALLIALITLALAMALPAAAQWSQDDFHVQRWALAEGLPGNHVSAIVQDQDGFLWLATMAGLVRFDGTSFQVFNETVQGMPSSRITALDSGLSGRLWIGTELGHVAVRENGIFRTVAEPGFPGQGLDPALSLGQLLEDHQPCRSGQGPRDEGVLLEKGGLRAV